MSTNSEVARSTPSRTCSTSKASGSSPRRTDAPPGPSNPSGRTSRKVAQRGALDQIPGVGEALRRKKPGISPGGQNLLLNGCAKPSPGVLELMRIPKGSAKTTGQFYVELQINVRRPSRRQWAGTFDRAARVRSSQNREPTSGASYSRGGAPRRPGLPYSQRGGWRARSSTNSRAVLRCRTSQPPAAFASATGRTSGRPRYPRNLRTASRNDCGIHRPARGPPRGRAGGYQGDGDPPAGDPDRPAAARRARELRRRAPVYRCQGPQHPASFLARTD